MLVGVVNAPTRYSPRSNPDRALIRRNTVIDRMRAGGFLTRHQRDSIKALPIVLDYHPISHDEGTGTYFRSMLQIVMTSDRPDRKSFAPGVAGDWDYKAAVELWDKNPLYGWCRKNTKANVAQYDLYRDGLKIYTTHDSRMQQYAEEAVREHFSKDLQPAFFKANQKKKQAPFSIDLRPGEVDTILMRAMHQTDRYRAMKKAGEKEDEIRKVFNTPVDMRVFSWNGAVDTIMSPMDSIRYHKSFLRTGFMSMDPRNGYVKAYVGGIDYNDFQYDMVNGGRRQIGSTIKPFLYSLAMIEGFSPCDEMMHVQNTYFDENGIPWTPRNASAKLVGQRVSIQWGLQNSDNWVTAWLMSQMSPYTFVRLLHSFGLKNQMDPVISICLGTPDVSVGEMVSGYTVFANKGIRAEPIYVTHIEDPYGNTIASFNSQMSEVLTEDASYKMLHMLKNVIDGGTGSRVRFRYGIKAPMGGKTGTTQNNSDGWFMAFTPSLVSGCWVGGEERSIHFDRLSEGQGASMALPIYGLFMQKVYADKTLGYSEEEDFDIPEQYANPCKTITEEERKHIPADTGGIDKMFE